jgi:hypothetical protein
MILFYSIGYLLNLLFFPPISVSQVVNPGEALIIHKTTDFSVSGDGRADNWNQTDWIELHPQGENTSSYSTKAKILYSETGIYFLFFCQDDHLTATMKESLLDLWKEDVVEFFLWPDEQERNYFEYEISPLNYELPLMIGRTAHGSFSWIPFHYGKTAGTEHQVSIEKRDQNSKNQRGEISSWTAEVFVPYNMLGLLNSVPPSSGTRWRANLYRVDYDKGESNWSWKKTTGNFHELGSFGVFQFE